jgi:lipoprotein NlpI
MGEYDTAIADFDTALSLQPQVAETYYHRALAQGRRGNYDAAVKDLSTAIEIKPGLFDAYFARGRNHFYAGRYAEAAADIQRSLSIVPGGPYRALWLELARARDGKDAKDELAKNTAKADPAKWPGPVIALFLGQADETALAAATQEAGDADGRKRRECQASFYLGERALIRGEKAEAKTRLEAARDTCPKYFIEREGAEAELRRLGP